MELKLFIKEYFQRNGLACDECKYYRGNRCDILDGKTIATVGKCYAQYLHSKFNPDNSNSPDSPDSPDKE